MRRIFKYPVPVEGGAVKLRFSHGACIQHVAAQGAFGESLDAAVPTMWVEIDDSSPTVERTFVVHGTGHPIAFNEHYVGTAHCGRFVWHIYEINQAL